MNQERGQLFINKAAIFGGLNRTLDDLDAHKMMVTSQTNVIGPLMLTQSLIENIKLSVEGKVMFLFSRAGLNARWKNRDR